MKNKISQKRNLLLIAGLFLVVAVLFYYVFTHNPANKENIYVSCTFKTITGWDCPGCGGQRALYNLLHFEFLKSLKYNALFLILIPYLCLLIFYEIRNYFWKTPIPRNFFTSNKMLWLFLITLLLFGILRNLPFYPFNFLSTS